jgi:hypothetical protein
MTEGAKWFRVEAGPKKGELRIAGWVGFWLSSDLNWATFQVCPVCRAVISDSGENLRGHEQWHARTDFPVPEELR